MSRLVFVTVTAALTLLASAGLARADEPAAPDSTAPPTTEPSTAPAPAPAADTGAWPAQIIDRPFALNKGMIDGHANVTVVNISIPAIPPATMGSSDTAEFLTVGAAFGVVPKLEVGADYFVELNPSFEAGNGPLILHGTYQAVQDAKMSLAPVGQFGVNFGGKDTTYGLGLGASFRYKVTPKIGIISPANEFNFGSLLAGAGTTGQLSIGLSGNQSISLGLPVGADIQATPEVYASVTTNIANIAIKDAGDTTVIFSDFIPLNLNLFYTAMAGKLDVGVGFSDDLKHAGDAYAISFMARFFKI